MGIAGNLRTMALAELLQWLSHGKKTGTLEIDGGEVEKKVFFRDGTIISSASTDPREYLGSFLVSHGYLTAEVVDEAVARQEAEKLLIGKILVNMGAIAEDDLHQVLRLKAEESVYDIFTWEEGAFEFHDGDLPAKTMIPMSLEVATIVFEGTRRLDEWKRIKAWIPSPLAVPVALVDLEQLEVDEVDKRILSWVDDERCVKDISDGSHTSLFLVSQVLASQMPHGYLKVVKPRIIEKVVEKIVEKVVEKVIEKEVPVVREAAPSPYPMPAYYPPPGYPPPPQHQIYNSGQEVGGRPMSFAVAPGTPASGGFPAPTFASPPTPSSAATGGGSEGDRLLAEAETALGQGRLDAALDAYRKAKAAAGGNAGVEQRAKDGEGKVQQAVELSGVGMKSKPKLKVGLDQLTKLEISPQEGFLLTRVDGATDIASLLKMVPIPKPDAMVFFWRLKNEGHLAV